MIYLGPLYFEQWTSWNTILIAVRRFAPATARVEGGDGQDHPHRRVCLDGHAGQLRAWRAHGTARTSLGRSEGLGPDAWGASGPRGGAPPETQDAPVQRVVLEGHAGQP